MDMTVKVLMAMAGVIVTAAAAAVLRIPSVGHRASPRVLATHTR
jgi:hypothetical protein